MRLRKAKNSNVPSYQFLSLSQHKFVLLIEAPCADNKGFKLFVFVYVVLIQLPLCAPQNSTKIHSQFFCEFSSEFSFVCLDGAGECVLFTVSFFSIKF